MSLIGVSKVTTETLVEDVPCAFSLYYRSTGGGPAAFPASDLAAIFHTTIWPVLKPLLASTVILMRHIVRPLDTVSGPPYEANYPDTEVGTGSSEPMPPSIAMLLRGRCTSLNSKNNPHVYIAGIPEDVWVNGAYTAGFVTLWNALQAPMTIALPPSGAGVTYAPCVVSRRAAGAPIVPPITYDINDWQLSPRISQQRRRQSGQQYIKT